MKLEINEGMRSESLLKSTVLFPSLLFSLYRTFAILQFFFYSTSTLTITKLIRKSNWKSLWRGKKISAKEKSGNQNQIRKKKSRNKRTTDNNGKFLCWTKIFILADFMFVSKALSCFDFLPPCLPSPGSLEGIESWIKWNWNLLSSTQRNNSESTKSLL